jgi:histidine ammonia-lyase
MATHGALKARRIAHNVAGVLGIELMAGAQGVDFHAPLVSSPPLQAARDALRAGVPFHARDRYLANDVAWAKAAVLAGNLADLPALGLF